MAYRKKIDPSGPTRQIGHRGALKQASNIAFLKSPSTMWMESSFEVLGARLLDLSGDVASFVYQPFTFDVLNSRVFKTKEELREHRQKLRDAGKDGIFYTPDFEVRWTFPRQVIEIQEFKDSDWVPDVEGDYGAKLEATAALIVKNQWQFNIYEARVRRLLSMALCANVSLLHAIKMQRFGQLQSLQPAYAHYLTVRESLELAVEKSTQLSVAQLAMSTDVPVHEVLQLIVDELVSVDLLSGPLGPQTLLTAKEPGQRTSSVFRHALTQMRVSQWVRQ